jgi:hypothetical protein
VRVCGVLGNLRDLAHRNFHGWGLVRGRIGGVPLASQTPSNGGSQEAVVLHRLVSKSEETEEDERAKDGAPPLGFMRSDGIREQFQRGSRELVDARVFPVGIGPGDPWANVFRVRDNDPGGHRDGEAEINGSQNNEAPVTAVIQVVAGGDELPESLPSPQERTDGED